MQKFKKGFISSFFIPKSVIKKSSVKYFLIFTSFLSSFAISSTILFLLLLPFKEFTKLSMLKTAPELNFTIELSTLGFVLA